MSKGRFTKGSTLGPLNHKWLGNMVGYFGLHTWVQRSLGKASVCSSCGSVEFVQWANISKKYKRSLADWKALCCVCHRKFDGITKLSKKQAADIIELYNKNITQRNIAKQYGICQKTVSNIVNNNIKYYV